VPTRNVKSGGHPPPLIGRTEKKARDAAQVLELPLLYSLYCKRRSTQTSFKLQR